VPCGREDCLQAVGEGEVNRRISLGWRVRCGWRRFRANLMGKPAQSRAPAREQVLAILALRRRRETWFGAVLFCDPAWDLLLELFAAALAGHAIEFGDLCASVRMPQSVVAGWLGKLAERGLIIYRNTPACTRTRIALSRRGECLMSELLREVSP
jgi:hypothetical protein